MNKANGSVDRIKIGLVIGLLTVLTGCAGYWGGGYYNDGGYYDGTVVVSEPDVYLFGGGYDRGRDVHNYSQRGSASRGAAHPGVSHAAARPSGGKGGRR